MRDGQAQGQHVARAGRVDDAVVPEARGGVVGRALALVALEDRPPQCLDLPSGQRAPFAGRLRLLDRRQHAGRLLAPHHRDARIRPHPEEPRFVGAPAHAVVSGAERSADDDRDLGHRRVRHGMHELGAVLRDARLLVLPANHEPGDVLQEDERHAAPRAELDEVRALERRFREEHAVVGEEPGEDAVHAGEAGHERRPVACLELVEPRPVDEAREKLADVVGPARVGRHDAQELVRVVRRLLRRGDVRDASFAGGQGRHDGAGDAERVRIVLGEIVGDAREARVDVGAAQLLRRHLLTRGRLHQGRAAEEDRPRPLHDHRLVRHRRHVGAACRARPHDDRDLRDARGRHPRLVVEDAAEVVAVGEDLGLERQERASRIDEVDAGKAVLERYLLRPEVLLDGDREVGAPLCRGVVGEDHRLAPRDPADAGHDAGARRRIVVEPAGGERCDLEERGPAVEQVVDALPRREPSFPPAPGGGRRRIPHRRETLVQIGHEPGHGLAVRAVLGVVGAELGADDVHHGPGRPPGMAGL